MERHHRRTSGTSLSHEPGTVGPLPRASLADTAGLTIVSVLGAFLLLAPVAYLAVPEVELPPPFADHHQPGETLLFLASFAILLPLAIRFVLPMADRIAAGPHGTALSGINALSWASMLGLLAAVKLSERLPWGGGLAVLFVAMLFWWLLNGGVIRNALRPGSARRIEALASAAPVLWWIAAGLLLITSFAFAFLESVSAAPLLIGALVAAATLIAYRRVRLPAPGRWGPAIDLALATLVFLAVPNLVILRPEVPSAAFETQILHFHQDLFLGPASHVLNGGPMLVETVSQYGVGSIDFVAGWFALVGAGNGTLGLLEGLLEGLVFVGAYFVIRAAGTRRPLAAAGIVFAIVTLVLGLVFPVGGLLQHGAIRFGMPMAVLVGAVAELRFPSFGRPARVVMLMFVGISSIWALEAFAYSSLTYLGILAAQVPLLPRGERGRWLYRRVGAAVIACLVAHIAFAAGTLIGTGELPDWGLYLSTLRAFLFGKIGDITYDFSTWSPGLAVGVLYMASAAGTAILVIRQRGFAKRERVTIVALAGSTMYGIALFSYLVNRSAITSFPTSACPR